jgi:hypothetical protein
MSRIRIRTKGVVGIVMIAVMAVGAMAPAASAAGPESRAILKKAIL